jgi:hypothetical protein
MDQFGLASCLVPKADMHWTASAAVGPRQAFDVAQGLWWRFDRYEVRDGCVRAARGARLEQYDPWDQYRAARDGDTRVDPPYAALVALVGVRHTNRVDSRAKSMSKGAERLRVVGSHPELGTCGDQARKRAVVPVATCKLPSVAHAGLACVAPAGRRAWRQVHNVGLLGASVMKFCD